MSAVSSYGDFNRSSNTTPRQLSILLESPFSLSLSFHLSCLQFRYPSLSHFFFYRPFLPPTPHSPLRSVGWTLYPLRGEFIYTSHVFTHGAFGTRALVRVGRWNTFELFSGLTVSANSALSTTRRNRRHLCISVPVLSGVHPCTPLRILRGVETGVQPPFGGPLGMYKDLSPIALNVCCVVLIFT